MILSARIPPPTTTEDLERFSEANPGWKIEREADGTIVLTPTNTSTGRQNARLLKLLMRWDDAFGHGEVFDSSTGFTMPDESVLSPDAAWIRADRYARLTDDERNGYAPIVPDVCIELVSKSDRIAGVIAKAMRYRSYGASYVVVIDAQARRVWTDGEAPPSFPTNFETVFT